MNRKDTLAAVAATGLVATYDAATGEYRVTYRTEDEPCAARREVFAYYTDDGEDAVDTAWAMSRNHRLAAGLKRLAA